MPRLRQCRAVLRSLLYLFLRRILDFCHSKERSATDAELEIAILRHQLAVLRRQVRRPIYRASDRAFLAAASRLLPREAWRSFVVRPETLLRWHRQLVRREVDEASAAPPTLHRPTDQEPGPAPRQGEPHVGYRRIQGELLVLGIRLSATSIATILRRAGLSSDATERADVEPVPQVSSRRHPGLRLPHRGVAPPQELLRAVLHRAEETTGAPGRRDEEPGLRLGDPAGQEHER